MQEFHQLCYFYFYKKNESKIYSYIIKNNNGIFNFFSSCVINHLHSCMVHVAKQIWYRELNGYIDYLIKISFCGQFLPNCNGNNINQRHFGKKNQIVSNSKYILSNFYNKL
jgi:hypothetical protein